MAHAGGTLHGHVLVIGLGGWTDAGEAATAAVRYLLDAGAPSRSVSFDAEQFLDYQVARPVIELDTDGKRRVKFPSLDIIELADPLGSSDITTLSVLHGYEPNRNWLTFVSDMIDAIETLEIDSIVFLGAMLADNPHSRPVQVMATTDNAVLQQLLDIGASDYEGPIGIFSAVAEASEAIDVPAINIWASVPHYAHSAPSPKATLALLLKFAEFTGIRLAFDALVAEAKAWELSIDAMTADDDDMTHYITQLERARDTVDSPDASGEAIAKEFEEYLRENDDEDDEDEDESESESESDGDESVDEKPGDSEDSPSVGVDDAEPSDDSDSHSNDSDSGDSDSNDSDSNDSDSGDSDSNDSDSDDNSTDGDDSQAS